MPARHLGLSVLLILLTVVVGLVIRFAGLGLPASVIKYGGSMLWALMVYWIVSTILPSMRLTTVVLVAGIAATAVEFFKLYHSPALDEFRFTLPGILLLGRIFSIWDILAYWIAIVFGGLLDRRLRSAMFASEIPV